MKRVEQASFAGNHLLSPKEDTIPTVVEVWRCRAVYLLCMVAASQTGVVPVVHQRCKKEAYRVHLILWRTCLVWGLTKGAFHVLHLLCTVRSVAYGTHTVSHASKK